MLKWLRAKLGFGSAAEVEKQRARAAKYKEWFESAMVMVDHVPVGVAWSDPKQDFAITYVNGFGKAMLGVVVPEKAMDGTRLPLLFPALAGRAAELKAPAGLPLRLETEIGALKLDCMWLASAMLVATTSGPWRRGRTLPAPPSLPRLSKPMWVRWRGTLRRWQPSFGSPPNG